MCEKTFKKFVPNKLSRAFTLAEILITLGIIGVVAAMTIPTLIANYQKVQTVTKLKKAYAEIIQAFKMAEDDHGSIAGWNFSGYDSNLEMNEYFSKNYLFPYMKVANVCIPSNETCWSGNVKSLDGVVWTSVVNDASKGRASFVSMSGYSVYYWLHDGNGTGGWIVIDINGNRKPNVLGKDVFAFVLTFGSFPSKVGLVPTGLNSKNVSRQKLISGDISGFDSSYRNVSGCRKGAGSRAGVFCAALIMLDGWKISPDYPW